MLGRALNATSHIPRDTQRSDASPQAWYAKRGTFTRDPDGGGWGCIICATTTLKHISCRSLYICIYDSIFNVADFYGLTYRPCIENHNKKQPQRVSLYLARTGADSEWRYEGYSWEHIHFYFYFIFAKMFCYERFHYNLKSISFLTHANHSVFLFLLSTCLLYLICITYSHENA